MGGYSSESAISLKSGNVVFKYLKGTAYKAYRILIYRDKWVYLDENEHEYEIDKNDFSVELSTGKIKFDCVFNAIHGSPGEDGLFQAYLQFMGIAHTSCDPYQAALTFNKRDLLAVLRRQGILMADSFTLNYGDTVDEDQIINAVRLPCFVKANKAGSSFGITKVHEKKNLADAIAIAFEEDDEILIESFLEGTEVSVGVMHYNGQLMVLPFTEIVSENDFFDYEAKYQGKSQEITPARLSAIQAKKLDQVARKIYTLLKLKGFSRSEFIFKGDEPYLLEVNTTPGLTEESILPQQALAAGISLQDLFTGAIETALQQQFETNT